MKRRILLAEDSERTRQSLKELLESDDQIQVETATDGEKAIKALTEHNYSIFLTDLKMPAVARRTATASGCSGGKDSMSASTCRHMFSLSGSIAFTVEEYGLATD